MSRAPDAGAGSGVTAKAGADRLKRVAKAALPAALLRRGRRLWEEIGDWRDVGRFGFRLVATRSLPPRLILFFGFAPGDDLLCTAVLRELRLRGRDRLMMVSNHPDLFRGNPDPAFVVPLWRRYAPYDSTVAICRRFARFAGASLVQPEYAPPIGGDRRRIPTRHIVAEMCARAGIEGAVSVRPYLHLTEAEKAAAAWARGCIIVQSSGLAARHPARNKEWFPERVQSVTDELTHHWEIVQLGSRSDPPLRHVRDLRGKTGMREAAAILYHARIFVGLEGFLMHVARAVECPSVIIFGGRTAPDQIGYVCDANLYSPVACAPCWRGSTCDFDRQCMRDIGVADVVAAVRDMLGRPRNPLATEIVDVQRR